jgi:HK97 family phage major capsid protein
MRKQKRELLARKTTLVTAMQAINDAAATASRDLTADEQTKFSELAGSLKLTNASIEREDLLAAEAASIGAIEVKDPESIRVGAPRIEADPKRGFRNLGEFAQAVRREGTNFTSPGDERLRIGAAAPTTFGSEISGADGGFSVPPQFAKEIWTLGLTEDALLPYTDNYNIDGNSMVFPKDETTPWGTDGIRAYWQAEAAAATQTKPKLSTATLRLAKLMALVPLTDELLQDTNALSQYLPAKVGASIRWKTNEAILNGLGNGTPLGALQGAAALTVAKDGSQSTATISTTNLTNMVARLPPGSYSRAVWLINNDVLGPLFGLTLGNYPVFLPIGNGVGGVTQNPYAVGMILGRPALISQHANTFSSLGDVMLFDLSYYWSITKAGGVESATSMHLYFDADATAFRTIFRVDGQPKIVAQISPFKGSNTMSPFLQRQAR